MKEDYTHITVILDRTGSMDSIRQETIDGFNSFLKEQKKVSGKGTLTLVQFDSEDPYEVIHHFKPIKKIPKLTTQTYVPRAATPLLDAIGNGILDLETCLGQLKEKKHPNKIVMVIITDGQENASRKFDKKQIAKMIKKKTKKDDWQFVFLSADLDAIGDAVSVGVVKDAALAFDKTEQGSRDAWDSLKQRTCEYRENARDSLCFEELDRKRPDDPFHHKG